uniref:hypothetical protein n=1 Tax=Microbacterium proteolyticum TaxID=1572644 RepID=UPI0024163F8E|nr:hypothetical protein [Microbacterium proteolyticum]
MGIGNVVAKLTGLDRASAVAEFLASPPEWADSSHLDLVSSLYGLADSSGIQVNRRTAMSFPVIAKGRRLLATNLGRMTLVNRKGRANAPLQMAYLQQPEEHRPLAATLTWTADALYFYPRTWWIVQRRDAAGWPARGGVKLLDRKDAQFDAKGNLTHAWGKPVEPRDIIQFDAPDGGLLHDGQWLLRRAYVLYRAASLAEENPVPGIELHNNGNDKLSPTQIVSLLENWMEARRRYGVAYTDKSIAATPMKAPLENLLIEGRKAMDLDLARQAGLPAWAADVPVDGSSITYNSRESRGWELIDLFLSTYMTAITSRLSMNDTTPIGWTTEFNTDELTRAGMKARFDAYKVGIDGGFIDQAWIDAQEGEPMKLAGTENAA